MTELIDPPVREGVVMLDAGLVHDIATTLTGSWHPDDEPDPGRRAHLLAAARVRIFAERDRFGLILATTPDARAAALGYDEAAWSVGFIQEISAIAGAPNEVDVEGLAQILRSEGIDGASAECLAYAVLFDQVSYVVTQDPASLRHQRTDDRPTRLDIMTPAELVETIGLLAGEPPEIGPPAGSRLATGPAWWLT